MTEITLDCVLMFTLTLSLIVGTIFNLPFWIKWFPLIFVFSELITLITILIIFFIIEVLSK